MDTIVRFFLFLRDNWSITLTVGLGLAAVYLLLPRPRPFRQVWGAAAAGLAVILAGIWIVRVGALTAETLLFYGMAGVAVVTGGLLVTQSNPARAALCFALVVLSTCGLFLLLAAPFLMAATAIIYAGAIIVTFLFVLMLAQQEGPSDADQRSREPLLASMAGFVLLGALLFVLQRSYGTEEIDNLLQKVRQAQTKDSLDQMMKAIGDDSEFQEKFFGQFKRAIRQGETQELAIAKIQFEWNGALLSKDVSAARKAWQQLEEIGRRARDSFGSLQPADNVPLSTLSGPPANLALYGPLAPDAEKPAGKALRRDPKTQWPQMPAENSAYLGRALFTDYLLDVELGGTLLLVATIGAIAIAGRAGGKRA